MTTMPPPVLSDAGECASPSVGSEISTHGAPPTLPRAATKKRLAAMRRNALRFENVPCFKHLPAKDRKQALVSHVDWEETLSYTPIGYLHLSCSKLGKGDKVPRQTVAWLVADYCRKHNVSQETLEQSITKANGDLKLKGLMRRRPEDDSPVFNLLALDDVTLHRVYLSIPEQHRPAEKRPREAQEPRRRQKKAAKAAKAPAAMVPAAEINTLRPPPVMTEEHFVWAACDRCDKWRRLFNTDEAALPEEWYCSMHPSGTITCQTAEERMDGEEQWDGGTKGANVRDGHEAEPPPSSSATESGEMESDWASDSHSVAGEHPAVPSSSTAPSEVGDTGYQMEGDGHDEGESDDDDLALFD